MAYEISSAPATEILTTQEAKDHLRVDGSEEDTLIDNYVTAARLWVERQWDLALITQTIKEYWDKVPDSNYLTLTVRPPGSVTSVQYYDEDNALQTFAASNYVANTTGTFATIELAEDGSWPDLYARKGALIVTYTAGFGSATSDVPENIRTAIRMLVAEINENREVAPGRFKARDIDRMEALLNPYIIRRA